MMRDWMTTAGGLLAALGALMVPLSDGTLSNVGMVCLGLGALLTGTLARDMFPRDPDKRPTRQLPKGPRSRGFAVLAAATLALSLSACSAPPTGDELSASHWQTQRARYVEDVWLAAQGDVPEEWEPRELRESEFPVGQLTWSDYQLTLEGFEVFRRYELAKLEGE